MNKESISLGACHIVAGVLLLVVKIMEYRPMKKEVIKPPRDHKCSTCEWANWESNKSVYCSYSPVKCIKSD